MKLLGYFLAALLTLTPPAFGAGWTGKYLAPVVVTGPTYTVTAAPYNALCNGAANDRAAIQSALTAVKATGGTLVFPANATCILGSNGTTPSIDLGTANNVRILGNNATLKAANSSLSGDGNWLMRVYNSTNIVIDGLNFDGNRAGGRTTGEFFAHNLMIQGGARISIMNLTSKNAPNADGFELIGKDNDGVNLASFPVDILFYRVTADNNFRQGMSVTVSRNLQIIDSVWKNTTGTNPEAGIDIEADVVTAGAIPSSQDILFRGNLFQANDGACINFSAMHATISRITIEGNRCIGGSPNVPGVWVNAAAIDISGDDFQIKNNDFENFAYPTVRALFNIQAGSPPFIVSNIIVDSNHFNNIDMATAVIYIHSVSNPGPFTISNNQYFNAPDVFVFNGHSAVTTLTNNTLSASASYATPVPPWTDYIGQVCVP